jgi:hypothetical protein
MKIYNKITVRWNSNDVNFDINVNSLMKRILSEKRETVINYINNNYNINCETFEGGIDDWFGIGSVTMCELGMQVKLVLNEEYIELTLE